MPSLFGIFLCFASAMRLTGSVRISNTEIRYDEYHIAMDAHDGNIVKWSDDGPYYFYAMGYQNCTIEHALFPPQECPGIYKPFGSCGFRTDHALRVYTSYDLVTWSLVFENALPEESRPYGIYFRPKVIYNALTERYVLWINHLADARSPLLAYPDAAYLVAASTKPQGPFEVVNERVSISQTGAGDFSILVDPNDAFTAYIAYDSWGSNHQIIIEELNAEYTDISAGTADSGFLSPPGNEAPILFERGGWYYLLYGSTCCFCKEGAGAEVLVASHPMGPWSSMNNDINPILPQSRYHTIAGQNSFTFQAILSDGSREVIFVNDRWSSAADNLKSHDLQYWQPLLFNDSTVPPSICPLQWQDNFELDL